MSFRVITVVWENNYENNKIKELDQSSEVQILQGNTPNLSRRFKKQKIVDSTMNEKTDLGLRASSRNLKEFNKWFTRLMVWWKQNDNKIL